MSNKRCKLTIIRGIPGSGKSTFAKENFNCLILENDMYHMHNGNYEWKFSNMKYATNFIYETCKNALHNGMDVVVANTFTKVKFIVPYKRLAEEMDANFEVLRCAGNWQNTHNVPQDVLESMSTNFEDWHGEAIVNGMGE